MKILVIGSGGREHAIVDGLSRSPGVRRIYAAPGNAGIDELAEPVPIAADDTRALCNFARGEEIGLTVVGPEFPLSCGVVDRFRDAALPIVGPVARQAMLESSKIFTKRFCLRHRIPTAEFQECLSPQEAYAALDVVDYPTVIKADGLAAGKGVVVARNRDKARDTVQRFMEARTLGEAGARVVFEEFLSGGEASFLAFADREDFQAMVPAADYKRRFDGDQGPNTGGMGAYSSDSILSATQREAVIDRIIRPALAGARDYSGILYAGLMLTGDGPRLLEFNVRLGDPEAQVVLPRLKTDLLEVFLAMTRHRLKGLSLEWMAQATVTVVLVSGGYPGKVKQGQPIFGLDQAQRVPNTRVYHAGTRRENGRVVTAGGRVVNVTAWGDTLADACQRAYSVAEMIEFDGKDFRRDIGRNRVEPAR